jgi:glycerol kinase
MADRLLLGIDEGTTGVKAALFDSELREVAVARRDKVNRHPQPGWVEQDGNEVLAAVIEAVGERARWWPAASITRASRCWPGTRRAVSR